MSAKQSRLPAEADFTAEQGPTLAGFPDEERWTFSLRYWDQIENFGLSEIQKDHFVDLIEGLGDAELNLGRLRDGDTSLFDAYHYHKVDWQKAKVACTRSMLKWLPQSVLLNEQDFPIYQIGLVRGIPRVLGFYGPAPEKIFYVVLVDLHHNAQKAKHFTKGTDCTAVLGAHHQLLREIDGLHNDLEAHKQCDVRSCEFASKIQRIKKAYVLDGTVYLAKDLMDMAEEAIQEKRFKDYADIFMTALLQGDAKK